MTDLIYKQTKTFGPKQFTENGTTYRITTNVRHDDNCHNGHNSFAITGVIDKRARGRWVEYSGGCLHDSIAKHFPELAPFIKWHLTSTDGPMHYVANTTYHATALMNKEANLEYARSSAVWPDATLEQLTDRTALEARLPALMADFRRDVEFLGFTY